MVDKEMTPEEKEAYLQAQENREHAEITANYSSMKTEIASDLLKLSYLTGVDLNNTDINSDNQKIADLFNDRTKGGGEIDRVEGVGFDELRAYIDIDEFSALSTAQQAGLLTLYEDTIVDIVSQAVQDQFETFFGKGSKTEIAIKALKKRPASRGELLGYGSNVKYWDVARARGNKCG